MDKVPEKEKEDARRPFYGCSFCLFCFVLRTCGMCWLDSTDKNQQRAFSCGSKAAIKHRNQLMGADERHGKEPHETIRL